MFRLMLGFVRKSAVSGNSTGSRAVWDEEEPELRAGGLWLGEVTGLRLGDAPGEDGERTKIFSFFFFFFQLNVQNIKIRSTNIKHPF